MPAHREIRELPHSAAQMYALVADVGRYQEFLPWVVGTRIKSDSETEMLADVLVGFKGLREQFSSRVIKVKNRSIDVDYIDGPLKKLRNEWKFCERQNGGCHVEFYVEFTFKNRMFEKLAGKMFAKALHKMTSAFVERADQIYGDGCSEVSGSSNSSAIVVSKILAICDHIFGVFAFFSFGEDNRSHRLFLCPAVGSGDTGYRNRDIAV